MPAVSQSWLILGKNQAYQGDLNAARLSLNKALALTQDADTATQAQEELANLDAQQTAPSSEGHKCNFTA